MNVTPTRPPLHPRPPQVPLPTSLHLVTAPLAAANTPLSLAAAGAVMAAPVAALAAAWSSRQTVRGRETVCVKGGEQAQIRGRAMST